MAGRGGGRRPPQEIPLVLQGRRLLAGLWIPLLYVFNFMYAMFVYICTSKDIHFCLAFVLYGREGRRGNGGRCAGRIWACE